MSGPATLPNEVWIVLTGALAAGASAILGSFLMLRRMSLLGDAISHAVLPGIVAAFLVTGSRAAGPVLLGAAAAGLLAAFAIESLHKAGRVQQDVAIGVTFTTLFSIGVVLVSLYGRYADLDQECVLYGEILWIPFDTVPVLGLAVPRATLFLALVFAVDLAFVILLWKELKFCSFDPEMARALGLRTTLVHYLLMGMVSLTVVAAFEAVGAILIVAMLIVPAATAYLLTERLAPMILLAVAAGAVSSGAGWVLSRAVEGSTAAFMTVAPERI